MLQPIVANHHRCKKKKKEGEGSPSWEGKALLPQKEKMSRGLRREGRRLLKKIGGGIRAAADRSVKKYSSDRK